MFVAVWIIYATDRLLDARAINCPLGKSDRLEVRHLFHHAHRRWFIAALFAGACLLVYLLHRADPLELRQYTLLGALLGAWLLYVHSRGEIGFTPPKEIVVGLFFPAAVVIPTAIRVASLQFVMLPTELLLAGICALNCVLLYAWEHPGHPTEAHWTTLWAARHLGGLSAAMILACGAVAILGHDDAAVACGLSVVALWVLHRLRGRLSMIHLRAAADLALLTPLLWFHR